MFMTGEGGWWRGILIALGLLFSAFCLFVIFVIGPKMKEAKAQKIPASRPEALSEDARRMFEGVYGDDLAMVTQQLDRGVDANTKNETGLTALHVTQNEAMARLLIARGADVNAVDEFRMTPIFNKETGLERILVDAGADIHARSERGNTPLMFYAYSGYADGIRYLISLGADVNAMNADGQTAYDIAEKFAHFELADYLRSAGGRSGNELK